MQLVHEIHSSELRGYRTCRQLWDWRYRDNWEPIKKPAPLEDGTVWHKALEVLYNPDTWSNTIEELHTAADTALVTEANAQRKEYLERAGKYQLDEEEALDYSDRITLLRSMLVRLCRTLDREKYRPVAVEQEFSCPILDENGYQLRCSCQACFDRVAKYAEAYSETPPNWVAGLPVTFNCRIDAALEDKEGYVYAVDHKSTAQLLREDSVVPELEDQLPLYLWCLRENNYLVTGMILNQFRKKAPHPPKLLERMQQGRMFSVNRMQLTDLYTARATFRQEDPRAYKSGLYESYLQWLEECGPQYDRQFLVIKTDSQLDIVGENLRKQVREIIDAGPAIYPNSNRMNCDNCSFQLPCFAKQSGADYRSELESSFIQSEPYYVTRRRQP